MGESHAEREKRLARTRREIQREQWRREGGEELVRYMDLHMPLSFPGNPTPARRRTQPATVIVLPVIRVERF